MLSNRLARAHGDDWVILQQLDDVAVIYAEPKQPMRSGLRSRPDAGGKDEGEIQVE